MSFSLHQRPKSPYWYAYFRTPDPDHPGKVKAHHKSTRQTTKNKAREVAREMEKAAKNEAGAGEEKSRSIYAILREAADLAANGNLNEAQGRELLSEMIRISTGKGLKVYTVREWFDSWLQDKEKANAQGTFVRYSGVVNQFLAFLPPERVDGNLMNLSAEDVRGFRDTEAASGKSPNTVNDAIKTVRTALNKARRQQIILSNPAEAVETLKEEELEKATFTPADIHRLLKAAENSWKGVILFGFFTGLNLRDITNLRWKQVELAGKTLSYKRQKTGKGNAIPLHSNLLEWLLEQSAPDDPEAFIFLKLANKKTGGTGGLSDMFRRLMKKAGLSGEAVPPAKGKKGERTKGRTRNTLTFHSLRHTFNSEMANAGVSQELRQKLTGHASAAMNDNYTHLEMEILRAAVGTVPGIGAVEEEGQAQ
jgi:integrase